MTKFNFIMCLAVMLGIVMPSASQNTDNKIEIWGNVSQSVKCEKSKKTAFGLYKIVVKDGNATFTPLATGDKHFAANGGGVIYDEHCEYINISGGSNAELRSFNTLNWNENSVSGEDVAENKIVTSAAAYDALNNKVYGCLTDNKGKEHAYGFIDYNNYRRTPIGYNDNHYVAMAVDKNAVLYGITIEGMLHKIDKRSGDKTEIGSTSVIPSKSVQAMAYNANNGKMYWAAAPKKGNSFLCEIDLTSGKINKVCEFADNDVISCMYIPLQPADEAPARLYDMHVVFKGALNKGNILFTLPTEHYNGSAISGDIEYDVLIDDVVNGSFKGKPGEKVNCEVMIDEAGMHEFKVVLKTNGKENVYNHMSKWIGYDEPSPIRNLKYYSGVDKIVYLSWKAPRGGRHGGYVDMDNLVYKIVRNPGGLVVAEECEETTFQDDVSSGGNNGFYYEVTPYVKEKK